MKISSKEYPCQKEMVKINLWRTDKSVMASYGNSKVEYTILDVNNQLEMDVKLPFLIVFASDGLAHEKQGQCLGLYQFQPEINMYRQISSDTNKVHYVYKVYRVSKDIISIRDEVSSIGISETGFTGGLMP